MCLAHSRQVSTIEELADGWRELAQWECSRATRLPSREVHSPKSSGQKWDNQYTKSNVQDNTR